MKDNHDTIPAVAHELAAVIGRLVRDNCDADERANALDALRETMDEAAGCRAATVHIRRRNGVQIRRRRG